MAENYDYMASAWADFVRWAASQPEMIQQFNEDTGRDYRSVKTGIESMIDRATGKLKDDTAAFVRWVTENHWGMEYAPQAYRDDCERQDREVKA